MYHNGEIRGNYYVNGSVDWFDYCDKDRMSMTEIDAMVKELGHEGLINYWYSIQGDSFDGGLVKLSEDTDVLDMLVFVPDTRVINIFLEHVLACTQEQFYSQVGSNIFINLDDEFGTNSGVVIQELDDNCGAIVPVGGGVSQVQKVKKTSVVIEELNEEGLNEEACGEGKELNEEGLNEDGLNEDGLIDEASKQGKENVTVNNEENSDKGKEKPSQGCSDKGKGKVDDMSHRVKRAFGKKRSGSLKRTKTVHHKDKVVEGRVDGYRTEFQRDSMMLRSGRSLTNAANFEGLDDDASDSEDSDYMIPKNFSEDEDKDDVFFDEWVDDQTEWTWAKETGNEAAPDWPTDVELDSDDSECRDYAKYNYDEEVDKNWPEFNAATDMADPKFEIGLLFSDCKVFRAAVREYSILQNRDVVFIRNEALKLKAVCGDPDCEWMIYASKMQHENTLQVKTYVGEHTCTQLWENPTVKSTWISKKYVHSLKSNPQWPVKSFKETVEKDYNTGVSRQQVYRAKYKALKLIEGSFNEQYSRVWDYCEELRKTNPGTTAMVKWQLLTVVGVDANNETWVIAYAVVESECKESWIWFLELLVKDCEIVNQFGFTFISDKQKGLVLAFEQVVPNCDHRFCARHLFSNYRVLFKAKSLRDKFWEASYATTVPHFTRAMEDLKKLSKDAYEWLTTPDKPPRHWSKSHFNTHLKCDMLLNNLCESFNATILECRDRPILSMFEYIRCMLMRRIQARRDKMLTWNKPICPRIFKKVEGNKAKAGACVAIWSGGGKFQVSAGGHAQYIVDLELRTCSCRAWDLQGWPCVHAIAAINYKGGLNVMDFVDDCYLKSTYLKTYENLILPMNGMDMWDKSDFPPCLPPSYSTQPGKPRKCRTKEQEEHKGKMKMRASRNQSETALSHIPNTQDSLKCGQCGKKGHNKRTCHRNLPLKAKPATKRKRGTENTQTTPSDASTLAGDPSTLKQRSKPPRRVQKGKPKPTKKRHATSEAQPASTLLPHASTSVSTAGSNVVH
ncbi:uncharacterized protein LOC18788539 [Prunus persica]|uniref:uncharacterized protein LOC18788539 n=1 Tax=Prunus persica TaxID=3760 RepID=UPI0009AB5563|nr:uncharacterized protein LOC18788539 [Prunus persica]